MSPDIAWARLPGLPGPDRLAAVVWWIVLALIVVPLGGLAVVASSVRDRVTELHRVRALAQEQTEARAANLQAAVARVQGQLATVLRQSAALQQRLGRSGRPGSGGKRRTRT